MIFTPHPVLRSNQEERDGQGIWHVWRGESCISSFGGESERKGQLGKRKLR